MEGTSGQCSYGSGRMKWVREELEVGFVQEVSHTEGEVDLKQTITLFGRRITVTKDELKNSVANKLRDNTSMGDGATSSEGCGFTGNVRSRWIGTGSSARNGSKVLLRRSRSLREEEKVFHCFREFDTSQALGGHQNAHRSERQAAKRLADTYAEIQQLKRVADTASLPPHAVSPAYAQPVHAEVSYDYPYANRATEFESGSSSQRAKAQKTKDTHLELGL